MSQVDGIGGKIEVIRSKNKLHHGAIVNYDRHLDGNTLFEHVCHLEIVNRVRSLIGDDVL